MKKSLIALSLVSVFAAGGASASVTNELEQRVDGLEKGLSGTSTRVVKNEIKLKEFEVKYEKDQERKQAQISSNTDSTNRNSIDIKNIKKEQSEQNQKINTNSESIKETKNKVEDNSSRIESNTSRSVKNTAEIEAVKKEGDKQIERIDSNRADIDAIYKAGDEATVYADQAARYIESEATSAYSEINGRVDSLEKGFQTMAAKQQQMEDRMNRNEGKMSNGIAGVAAMANIPTVAGEKLYIGAGIANFNGSNAIALGATKAFENGIAVKASVSYAEGKFSQKDTVVGAGVAYGF